MYENNWNLIFHRSNVVIRRTVHDVGSPRAETRSHGMQELFIHSVIERMCDPWDLKLTLNTGFMKRGFTLMSLSFNALCAPSIQLLLGTQL